MGDLMWTGIQVLAGVFLGVLATAAVRRKRQPQDPDGGAALAAWNTAHYWHEQADYYSGQVAEWQQAANEMRDAVSAWEVEADRQRDLTRQWRAAARQKQLEVDIWRAKAEGREPIAVEAPGWDEWSPSASIDAEAFRASILQPRVTITQVWGMEVLRPALPGGLAALQ